MRASKGAVSGGGGAGVVVVEVGEPFADKSGVHLVVGFGWWSLPHGEYWCGVLAVVDDLAVGLSFDPIFAAMFGLVVLLVVIVLLVSGAAIAGTAEQEPGEQPGSSNSQPAAAADDASADAPAADSSESLTVGSTDNTSGFDVTLLQVFEVPADATGLRLKVSGSLTASGIAFQL